jgi:penicillin-binding protein-related factor A (putative recombinase)
MSQRRLPGTDAAPHSSRTQAARSHAGAKAEEFVDHLNEVCHRAGIAFVARVGSHVKILRRLKNGRIEGVITGKSVVDLMGWARDGRAIAAEVKHVSTDRLKDGSEAAWRLPLARVEEHQRAMLRRCHADGGIAFVLIVHGAHAYAVPWPVVEKAITRGAASLSRDDITPHRCDHRAPYLARLLTPPAAAAR